MSEADALKLCLRLRVRHHPRRSGMGTMNEHPSHTTTDLTITADAFAPDAGASTGSTAAPSSGRRGRSTSGSGVRSREGRRHASATPLFAPRYHRAQIRPQHQKGVVRRRPRRTSALILLLVATACSSEKTPTQPPAPESPSVSSTTTTAPASPASVARRLGRWTPPPPQSVLALTRTALYALAPSSSSDWQVVWRDWPVDLGTPTTLTGGRDHVLVGFWTNGNRLTVARLQRSGEIDVVLTPSADELFVEGHHPQLVGNDICWAGRAAASFKRVGIYCASLSDQKPRRVLHRLAERSQVIESVHDIAISDDGRRAVVSVYHHTQPPYGYSYATLELNDDSLPADAPPLYGYPGDALPPSPPQSAMVHFALTDFATRAGWVGGEPAAFFCVPDQPPGSPAACGLVRRGSAPYPLDTWRRGERDVPPAARGALAVFVNQESGLNILAWDGSGWSLSRSHALPTDPPLEIDVW